MAGVWFDVIDLGRGIRAVRERLREGTEVKSFLVEGERQVAVIDTGAGVGDYRALVESLSDKEPINLQTHGHWDHTGGCWRFDHVLIHPEDARFLRAGEPHEVYRTHFGPAAIKSEWLPEGFDPETAELRGCDPTGWLNDGDTIDLGGRTLEVIHTPGHSPGSVSFLDREARVLIPGDAIRTDYLLLMLDGSDPVVYRETLRRVVGMLDAVDTIYSAHNPPLVPDDVRRLQQAYETVWSGMTPSTPEQAPPQWQQPGVDVHIADGFTFLVPEGTIPVRG